MTDEVSNQNSQPVVEKVENNVQQEPRQESEREECNRLLKEDPRFAALMKATTFKSLGGIVGVLSFIVLIVFLAVPYIAFTGVNIHPEGKAYLDVYSGGAYPFSVNRFTAVSLYHWVNTLKYAFSPSESMNATVSTFFYVYLILGIVLCIVFILGSLLTALPRGYRFRTYKKDNGVSLYKELKTKQSWIISALFIVVLVANSIIQYFGWKDLTYKSTNYYYGEITGDPSNMIATTIVGVIVLFIIIGVSVAFNIIATKMVKKHFE